MTTDERREAITVVLSRALTAIEEAFKVAVDLPQQWQGEIDLVREGYDTIIGAQSYLDPQHYRGE